MLLNVLGFLWPPLGWKLRLQKFEANERRRYVEWYKNEYIPVLQKQAATQIEEYKKPCLFKNFITS